MSTRSQGEDIQAEKMYGLHHRILFRLIEAAQPVSISQHAHVCEQNDPDYLVKQYERANEKNLFARVVRLFVFSLCAYGGRISKQTHLCTVSQK